MISDVRRPLVDDLASLVLGVVLVHTGSPFQVGKHKIISEAVSSIHPSSTAHSGVQRF